MSSSCSRSALAGGAQHGAGEVRSADRFAFGDALFDLGFVEVEADLAQAVAHTQRALLAVGQELLEASGHRRPGVVDAVAEDVQFAHGRGAVVDRGDLDGRHDLDPDPLAGCDGLGDARDRVVVGEGEQLDAGLGGKGHHLLGGEHAVGVGRVGLQIEAQSHGAQGYAIAVVLVRMAGARRCPPLSGAGQASPAVSGAGEVTSRTRRSTAWRRRRTAAW